MIILSDAVTIFTKRMAQLKDKEHVQHDHLLTSRSVSGCNSCACTAAFHLSSSMNASTKLIQASSIFVKAFLDSFVSAPARLASSL